MFGGREILFAQEFLEAFKIELVVADDFRGCLAQQRKQCFFTLGYGIGAIANIGRIGDRGSGIGA